ncbi:periplasmic protein [Aeromonas diversa CDC 2478-85]|uniref:Periplasmic protein n=2 Tax=Aeromonas diversa TaxID=502790 RepID=N9U0N2_9GAMM|nr:periplasmic protein [Aeromonas diversa CDC 2478-85]
MSLPYMTLLRQWRVLLLLLFVPFFVPADNRLDADDQRLVTRAEQTYGARAGKRVATWRLLAMEGKGANWSEKQRLERVNNFFNQMRFVDDIKLWRRTDYWATPLEFLGAAGGDCEDFSISKYFTLLELGIPDEKMRMVYVKALRYNQFHMVVAYYETPGSVPLILDNLIPDIRPATRRADLAPVFSFNGSHLWLMKARGQGELAGNSSRLGLWNDLRNRMTSGKLAQPKMRLE